MIDKTNLSRARTRAKDEFYTCFEDIEKLMSCYAEELKNKFVFLPCDCARKSEFFNFFYDNFDKLQLKKLECAGRDPDDFSIGVHVIKTKYVAFRETGEDWADFRSEAVKNRMSQADIIITNPPFSLFREFFAAVNEMKKDYILIGNFNAVSYKTLHEQIKNGALKIISRRDFCLKYFFMSADYVPNGKRKIYARTGKNYLVYSNACWFTSLRYPIERAPLILSASYDPQIHKKYDNYHAINCDKTKDIPADYFGEIGVPITYLDRFNPAQFDIVGFWGNYPPETVAAGEISGAGVRVEGYNSLYYGPAIDQRAKYARIIIKRREA